jgi:hypothetical protein
MIVVLAWPWTAAEAKTTTLVAFDYEHDGRGVPYQMCPVDGDRFAGLGRIITMPPRAQDVCGVRFKVTRVGSPGRLLYRLGRTKGGSEIASGAIAADDVVPLYELLYGGDFPAQKVVPGQKLYLTLRAERGKYPDDYYLVYGPRPGQGAPADAQGEPISPPGQKGVSLSYQLRTSVGSGDSPRGEERFAFVREITAPPYAHARRLRDPDRKPRPGETAIDRSWTIVGPPRGNRVIDTAIEDIETYFDRCLAVHLAVSRERLSPETLQRERVIVVGEATSLPPQLAAGLKPSESYRVKVEPRRVVLCGADDRGAMRAVYYLEDVLGFAAGPYLKQGDVKRNCLFSPRITHAIAPNCTFVNDLSQPNIYSDGLLWHISHQGFNAIFLYGNLEEVTYDSRVFPELNDVSEPRQFGSDEIFPEVHDARAPLRRLQRLRELVDRAARFGIDVYLYYATNYHHPVPKWFYEKYPDCQGCGWGGSMCTSSPKVQQYLAETTRNLFRAVPRLKGLVVIFDSEGFFNDAVCYDRSRCPRCRNRQPEDIAAELITIIDKAMKACRPDAELIAWSYFTKQPPWVIRTIPKLPKDVTFQAEFSKGAIVVCDGIRYEPMDYVISQIGPPECFREQAWAAERAGLKLSAKTEHAVSWELYNVPYLPIPFQFQRRITAIRQYPVHALFTNWVLYGYVPNMPAEVLKWYSWDKEPAIDELLLNLAGQEFGAQAGPKFVEAWRHFSTAITYYPYSDSIARHPGPIHVGPAQPLYLDRGKSSGKVWCTWQNSLGWTEPWGPAVTLKYFGLLEAEWQRGIEIMERAMADVPADRGEAARREYGIAKSILCSVRSCENVIRFLVARENLYREPDAAGRETLVAEMRRVANAEIRNTREALPLCEADSRIGYATVWGDMRVAGFFTPALLRWKIAQVEQMIREELPRFDPTWTRRLPGFHHMLSTRADRALLPSYREDHAWLDICYCHKPGSIICWETAPVPNDVPTEGVAFAFAGGLSHAAPPGGEGFTLEINGKEIMRFAAPPLDAWKSSDKRVELQFEVVRYTGGGDPMGLFYLKVPRNLLTPGEPCRLGVRSLRGGAGGWFALNRYNDVR